MGLSLRGEAGLIGESLLTAVDTATFRKSAVYAPAYPRGRSCAGGDQSYTPIKQVNASYQQMWPAQYVPVRDAIVESYNPSILADVTAHGLEIPSPILMSDNIH
jgi:hypothetical protein